MLAAIGETFETPYSDPSASNSTSPAPLPPTFSNEITGVIVSARKAFFRINIWTRTSSPTDQERIENIGRHFKYGVLGFDKGGLNLSEKDKVSSDVEFVSHKDSQAKVSLSLSLSFAPLFFVRQLTVIVVESVVRYESEQMDCLETHTVLLEQSKLLPQKYFLSILFFVLTLSSLFVRVYAFSRSS